MVPAPAIGDNKHFLRGDGTWARADSGNVVLDTVASAVEGALWKSSVNDAPLLKLRHGDYEYNFQYDSITYLGGSSSATETVEPDTYILGTASVSSEGGIWYEITDNVPMLWFHSGNFNYGINYSTITYKGGNSHLAAYLPFNVSPTADACGNTWTVTGSPAIVNGALSLNGDHFDYLTNSTIADSIGNQPWTVDLWMKLKDPDTYNCLFGVKATNNDTNTDGNLNWSITASSVYFYNNNSVVSENRVSISPNIKQDDLLHLATTYDGSCLRTFVNGVLKQSVTVSLTVKNIFTLCASIGGFYPSSGSVSHFRIFKGVALWTENFTPPTAEDYL